MVEFFIETAGRARILTAGMDMRRPPNGDLASWRFVGAEGLTFVEGLYKLRIDKRPLAARNLEITSEDLVLSCRKARSSAWSAMTASPADSARPRRDDVFTTAPCRSAGSFGFFGSDTLTSPFESAFVRSVRRTTAARHGLESDRRPRRSASCADARRKCSRITREIVQRRSAGSELGRLVSAAAIR